MIDNQTLKAKVKRELKNLRLNSEQEEIVLKEINYLSNLLIEVYLERTKNDK